MKLTEKQEDVLRFVQKNEGNGCTVDYIGHMIGTTVQGAGRIVSSLAKKNLVYTYRNFNTKKEVWLTDNGRAFSVPEGQDDPQ